MSKTINIIDLFAGPGGLGEGFSAFATKGHYPFQIKLSVEYEKSAHKTLMLRSFIRKFRGRRIPQAYYDYLQDPKGNVDLLKEAYPDEWNAAASETMGGPKELGSDDDAEIFTRLAELKKSKRSEPFIVIGGPPCQAYSVMGRIKNRSIAGYKAEDDHRHFLYKEYLKVLDVIKPEVFVMENVRGILTAEVNDQKIFPKILSDLSCPAKALGKTRGERYVVFSLSSEPDDFDRHIPRYNGTQQYVIKCEDFGIPQTRHRVILLGVREDIARVARPGILKPSPMVTTDQILEGLPRLRSAISRKPDNKDLWLESVKAQGKSLMKILLAHGSSELAYKVEKIAASLTIPKKQVGDRRFLSASGTVFKDHPSISVLRKFMEDARLGGCLNHYARGHMASDLQRYLFCSAYAEMNHKFKKPSPTQKEFPVELAPNHKSWKTGKFADRFKVQHRDSPSSTITSHINRDGHFFIHYDPSQCRSLSVREAARLQTFPDNYFFEGNYTQQYVQVGNAVPPYLAYQVAQIVAKLFC